MAFYESQLDLGYDYGAEGGRSWSTYAAQLAGGQELRNQNWSEPLGEWQLGNRNIKTTKLKVLQDFHGAMRGRLHGFRYKDWTDYKVAQELLTLNNTVTTQLIKTYGSAINPYVRSIKKPVAGFVLERNNNNAGWVVQVLNTNYTVNLTTGVISWIGGAPNPATVQARWSGSFDVPVRFDRDVLSAQYLHSEAAFDVYSIGNLSVKEIRT